MVGATTSLVAEKQVSKAPNDENVPFTCFLNSSRSAVYTGGTNWVMTVPKSMIVLAPILGLNARSSGEIGTRTQPTLIPSG
ncbi:hypothetical protein EV2_045241 [Malus domestica]